MDFKKLADAALQCIESLVTAWFPAARREGPEWKVGSLQGEPGRSLSINSRTGVWKDFTTDDGGGDLISLLAAIRGCKMKEAAIEMDELLQSGFFEERPVPESKSDPQDWEPLDHAPSDAPEPPDRHYKHGTPAARWEYRTETGEIIGYVYRFNLSDGGKDLIPLSWCRNAGGKPDSWRWKSFAKPRPLYGLDRLAKRPNAPVLIVEGEKCADAAQAILTRAVVVTWPGGSKAIRYTDFSALAERKVTIWPDADEAGQKAAEDIASILEDSAASVKIMQVYGKPKGWDIADAIEEGWQSQAIVDAIRVGVIGEQEEQHEEVIEEYQSQEEEIDVDHDSSGIQWPFRILGYNKTSYFYLPNGAQQIVELSPNEHRELQLLHIAPAYFWESAFPQKEGANWKAAANAMIQTAQQVGLFSQTQIRGRGAWIDQDCIIYHMGDQLIIDGVPYAINQYAGRYVYELSDHIDSPRVAPADNKSARKLLELCELMPWRQPLHAKLLAGWLVVAPISGVMQWRPHIWLNGPSGTGKSWILTNVVQQLIGRSCLNVQSATTEAGIRQSLGSDSLPVIFDEAESEDKRGQIRIQSILELARGASSETGAGIAKGSASGEAMVFRIRSCFCFASIGVAAIQKADISRISSLELQKAGGEQGAQAFERIKQLTRETALNSDWCDSIRSRSLANARTIRENAIIFAAAVAAHLGDQRVGDQLGTLLAGAWSLTSSKQITREAADQWVQAQEWEQWMPVEADKDEMRAFAVLREGLLRFEPEDGLSRNLSVSELIEIAMGGEQAALKTLNRHGIKIRPDGVVAISNSHRTLAVFYSETPWANKWKHQLMRLPNAQQSQDRIGGVNQRCVLIPIESFFQ